MYLDKDNVPFYVGKGSGKRFYLCMHLSNGHLFLKRKIKKIGADNIKVHFLHENLTETEAFKFETFYIGFYGRRDLGEGTLCNLTNGGEGISGNIRSEKTKQKMSKAAKGKNNHMYGKHHSEEAKRKISEANKGNQYAKGFIHSKKFKRKISMVTRGENNPFYGKNHSENARKKMSKAHKGKKLSEEHKQKISKAGKGKNNHMYGKHHSEESKNKISVALKLYWAKRKGLING